MVVMIVVWIPLDRWILVHLIRSEVGMHLLRSCHHWRAKPTEGWFVWRVSHSAWLLMLHLTLMVPGLSDVPPSVVSIEWLEAWHVTISVGSDETRVPCIG